MARFSIKDRIRSFKYALRGILFMMSGEHNFYIHMAAALLVIVAGIWLQVSRVDWLWLVLAMGLVLSAETFNSAIEKLVDLKEPDQRPEAGKVKDMAAGAVLLAAITAAIIGVLIFWPYLQAL